MGRHREFDVDRALDAALGVFWRKGYEGTSLGDLTEATGVARPGLYSAFGDKQTLFLRALDRYDRSYMTFMSAALLETTSLRVVERLLQGSAAVQTSDDAHPGCMGLNGALACSDDAEPIRLELVKRRAASERALRERLERARAEGDLPKSSDPVALAAYVMAVSQGMAVQAKSGASRRQLESVLAQVLAAWPSSGRPSSRKRKP